jgi:ABC-type glutathione transport system ATPase component
MRLVAERSEWVLVLHQGRLLAEGRPREIFVRPEMLAHVALAAPPITRLAQRLGSVGMRGDSLTVEEFYEEYTALKGRALS